MPVALLLHNVAAIAADGHNLWLACDLVTGVSAVACHATDD
jgi:hypothetical protein